MPVDDPPPPFVSVVIPVRDEARHIEACLRSVLDQDYPEDRYEVILADGGSTDDTRAIVARVGRGRDVRVIDNPSRTQAAGLNRAIAESRGQVVARQDGHATWAPTHLRRCVELLAETGADNVGGRQDAVGEGDWGRAVAAALHSPLGVGGARHRTSTRTEDAPTVFLGTFRRDVFDRVGFFDETAPPHEDYELNHRIRAGGGRVIYSPDLVSRSFVRESPAALVRQYFRYGRAKVRVARHTPGVVQPYHLAAPLFTAAVAAAPAALTRRRGRRAVAGGAALYASVCLVMGSRAARTGPASALRTACVFPLLHLAWGAGFWTGVAEAVSGR